MVRLLASPLQASDFIAGYTLPLIPLALGQTVVCFIAAVAIGLSFTANT
jgi:ABC-2 type transport system permease protein